MVKSNWAPSKWGILSCVWSFLAFESCRELPRSYDSGTQNETMLFLDNFDRDQLGEQWKITGPGYKLENGRLSIRGARNHPLWLNLSLPDNFRVDFDAWALSDAGDIKVEIAGDGKSFATKASYTASGYVIVFGGWQNSLNMIARKDEHGDEKITSKQPTVSSNRRYHMTIIRNGAKIRWLVDGQELLQFYDEQPLVGPSNRNFAFNGWESATQFDNLVVRSLPSVP